MDEETPKSFFLSFNNHPALQKVKLTAFGSSTAKLGALKINQLEEVDITNVDFTVNDWKVFTTNNPNIKSLIIFHTPLNTEGLEQIVNNLIHLEEIEITYEEDFQFQYADLKLILEKCKHMKRIYGVLKEEPEHYLEIFKEFAEKLKTIKCWFQNAGNSDINIVNLL